MLQYHRKQTGSEYFIHDNRMFTERAFYCMIPASSGKQTELLISCLAYFSRYLGTVSDQVAADIILV